MTTIVATEQESALQNQYPHLSIEEIREYLSRTPAQHLKNQYPHLSDQEIENVLAQSRTSEESAPTSTPPFNSINFDALFFDKVVTGMLQEEMTGLFKKYFPFLDIDAILDDLTEAAKAFAAKVKANSEFESAFEAFRMDPYFNQFPLVSRRAVSIQGPVKPKPAARPRASRAKGGNAGAAGSKKTDKK